MSTTELLQGFARAVDAMLRNTTGRRINFSLIIWEDGEANYVSNADRASVKKAMAEVLERWDQPHYKGQ